jgi:GNAT superfamily N-acetyltransferase
MALVWTVTAEEPAEDLAVIAEAVFAHGRALASGGNAQPIACLVHDGDRLIAGGSGRTEYERLFVSYLWVGKAHRRRGIARRILQTLEAEATLRGCRDAIIETLDDAVASMYERLGYQQLAHVPCYVGPFSRHIMLKPALAT